MKLVSKVIKDVNISKLSRKILRFTGASIAVYFLFAIEVALLHTRNFTFNPQEVFSYLFELKSIQSFPNGVISLDITNDDEQMAIAGGPIVKFIDLESGSITSNFSDPNGKHIDNIYYIKNDKQLLIGYTDQTLAVLNLKSNQITTKYKNPFKGDRKKLSVSNPEQNHVIFQAAPSNGLWPQEGGRSDFARNQFLVWGLESMSPRCLLWNGGSNSFTAGAINPNNQTVAFIDQEFFNGKIEIVRLSDCSKQSSFLLASFESEELFNLMSAKVGFWEQDVRYQFTRVSKFSQFKRLKFSPDSQFLVAAIYHQLWVYDINLQKRVKKIGPDDPSDEFLSSVTFSPDGKIIAAGSNKGVIRLWDFNTGKLLRRISDKKYDITILRFTNDGKNIIAASDNRGFIRIWETGI